MARKKKSTPEVENVRAYVEGVAKSLVDRLYGPSGPAWGTRMSELEDVVVAVREALSEKMLADALARQANSERPESLQTCPSCQRSLPVGKETEPREVQTRGGQAEWSEPKTYCCQCRRSFFPSESKFGD